MDDRELAAITPRMAEAGKAKLIELGYEGVEFTDAQKVYLAMLEASPAALAKAGRLASEVKGDATWGLLTDREKQFCKIVATCPGSKLRGEPSIDWYGDGETVEAVWKRPEALGIVECVGGWRWKLAEGWGMEVKVVRTAVPDTPSPAAQPEGEK